MKPRLLLYCQHSLGLGHFMRSLALAEALVERFEVIFFNGGPVPMAVALPRAIRFVHLPPLRMEEDGSLSGKGAVEQLIAERRDRMLAAAGEGPVAALLIELYPFGRKKFAAEIDPLIARVREQGGKIVCSVRDLLVTGRVDQERHDQRAADKLNATFDAVLVHSDERIFCLAESFRPNDPLRIPVQHTGFVTRTISLESSVPQGVTLVTAGGGVVGRGLYEAAIAAQSILWEERGWPMVMVAGPLLPDEDWQAICDKARDAPWLTLVRAVPSLQPLLQQAGRVVSQCGYNSALEILQARKPVLFVPFSRGQESEQTARARQLTNMDLANWAPEQGLSGERLAELLLELKEPSGKRALDMRGAQCSAAFIAELAA
ncbi:MAG: hypothetical protein EP350_06525 [Alphaproteobacteria bacterium]|nr:MAG: hypothetical protein EP350_06525 [Alphaproteobacteria bacterium]